MHISPPLVILTCLQALLVTALPARAGFTTPQPCSLRRETSAARNVDRQSCDDASTLRSTQTFTRPQAKAVTFVGRRRQDQTVTLTSLPSTQSPYEPDQVTSAPGTTGTFISTIATEGNPSSQPFATSLPSAPQSILQPANSTAAPLNRSTKAPPLSLTATVTLPLTTFETVVTNLTVVSIPVPTVVNISSITVAESTYTSDRSIIVTSTVQPTTIHTTATVLKTSTVIASATVTNTVSTVLSTGTLSSVLSTSTVACQFSMGCGSENLFQPVAVGPPPSVIPSVPNHPVPRLGITGMDGPIQTNKFYFNFFLGSQSFPAFVQPYSLAWSKGGGNAQSWGMVVSHVDDSQKVFGPNNTKIPGAPASYFINPLGIQSIILSAAELGTSTVLTTDSLAVMSGNANLSPKPGSNSHIKFPMVQGMAFVTAIYESLQLEIQSSVFFRSVESRGQPKPGVYKYRLILEDGKIWLLYAIPSYNVDPNLQLRSSTMLQGIPNWSGLVQIAKLPPGANEGIFDAACGLYPTSGSVGGSATNSSAQYSLSWTKAGPFARNGTLLMYALPHHMASFDDSTASKAMRNITLQTTTKGVATAIAADCWILNEELHPTMGFAPWRPDAQIKAALSQDVVALIQNISTVEASQDMNAQTNLNSMYYSGKGLAKFATIIYTMSDLVSQQGLATAALDKLKNAFAVFTNNTQQFPLYYDTDWKGVVSSASYKTRDPGVDFGNSYYNDHHFHYGYFIYAAAVIGYLDPVWAQDNKDYVNALVRDVANPSTLDTYFPVFRSFDWYNGHSWAKGLFETGDGKDEESTSEDANFAYGLKMWGRVIGDVSMERRGDLMLSVVSRAIQSYFLMESDNKIQPAQFIGNKASGILFENKIDHVTYFGTNPEYIQGIQMIPAQPFSTLTRTRKFVQEEWTQYFADGAIDPAQNVVGGWKGILFGNLAIINPQAAYNFFSQKNFDASWLDSGASLTWYLAYSAALGGSS